MCRTAPWLHQVKELQCCMSSPFVYGDEKRKERSDVRKTRLVMSAWHIKWHQSNAQSDVRLMNRFAAEQHVESCLTVEDVAHHFYLILDIHKQPLHDYRIINVLRCPLLHCTALHCIVLHLKRGTCSWRDTHRIQERCSIPPRKSPSPLETDTRTVPH